MSEDILETRECLHCKQVKPISEFEECEQIESGYYWDCIDCRDKKQELFKLATGVIDWSTIVAE